MDPERDMTDLDDDLRSTAEDVFIDAGELKTIEKVKAALPADDPRVLPLAKKAGELGAKIAAKTEVQLAIAEEATRAG